MLNQIIEKLKSSAADAWEITETIKEGWEFYLIRHALDQNRVIHTKRYNVKVFCQSEDGQFLGSAGGELSPTLNEEEIRHQVDQMILAARLVKNPVYTLNKPEEKSNKRPLTAPIHLEEISAAFLQALAKVPETDTEDINSAEVFVSAMQKRFINSEGIDVMTEYPSSMVEAVVNARRDGHEIELYRMYTSGACDEEQLNKDLIEVLFFGRDRLQAVPTPSLGKADVVFSTDAAKEIYLWYADRMNAAYKYMQYSDWEIDQPVAEADEGDLITLSAVPDLPNSSRNFAYDAEGAPIRETVLIQENIAKHFLGARQYSQYLNLEDSFQPSNLKVSGGSGSSEELRQGNYLEPVEFSDFQVNSLTGDIAGEIRLAYWHHDGEVTPVTGGSVSGNMQQFAKNIRFSRETRQYDWLEIPSVTRLTDVTIAGAE